jgi:hypothetical protein
MAIKKRKSTRKKVVKNTAKSTKLFKLLWGKKLKNGSFILQGKSYHNSSVKAFDKFKYAKKYEAKNDITVLYKLNRKAKVYKLIKK